VKIVPISYGESGITDLQDGNAQLLEGNYVAIILAQVAGEFGLTPATAKPINMRVIAAHKIDAAWLPEPFGTEAEQEYGAVQLADFDQGALQDSPSAVEQALMTSRVAPTQEYAIGVLNKRYDIADMTEPEPGEIK